MINYLLTIIICSLYCFGIWIASSDGMILHGVRELSKKYLPEVLYKPLFGCVVCFASIHGGYCYILLNGIDIMIIPALVATSGLNYILAQKYA